MSKPRDLAITLPSPSELDNFHRCPCLWWLKDRLWIKPVSERLNLIMGRIVDRVMDAWLCDAQLAEHLPEQFVVLLQFFDAEVDTWRKEKFQMGWLDDFEPLVVSTKDAVKAWLEKYGQCEENVFAVQPKFTVEARAKVDYLIEMPDGRLRVRERKLISPFADLDDEMMKYEMGMQPLCYAAVTEQETGREVECVEFEFLVRSAPQRGRYKALPARAERREVFVEPWKKTMWQDTAAWTNFWMNELEHWLIDGTFTSEGNNAGIPFEVIPRFTRNCIQKWGTKNYECEYYKACKTNVNPLVMTDYFHQDEQADAVTIEEA